MWAAPGILAPDAGARPTRKYDSTVRHEKERERQEWVKDYLLATSERVPVERRILIATLQREHKVSLTTARASVDAVVVALIAGGRVRERRLKNKTLYWWK